MIEVDVHRRLGAFNLDVAFAAAGETVVLFGHSGSGKSVTLQSVAGLMRPDAGRVVIDGRVVFDAAAGIDVPPQERGVGYVVQHLALFPHLTVRENVEFGVRGTREERRRRASEVLALLDMAGFDDRRPGTLSGGQQQRVALARALARDVRLLLLDEPFSALDDALRRNMRAELVRLRNELGLSVLFVTHDLREAHLLADRLAVFDAGRVLQYDTRDEVFAHPASRRVAELTGVANVFGGRVRVVRADGIEVESAGRVWHCVPVAEAFRVGDAVDVAIRAERVILRRGSAVDTGATNSLEATVVEEHAYGATHTLLLDAADGMRVEVDLASRPYEVLGVAQQRTWTLELPPGDLHVMRAAGSPEPNS